MDINLRGRSILVVEDDYFLATATCDLLGGLGAEVLGPCSSEEEAMRVITSSTPTSAVIDLNLGEGPRFEVARLLKARGVPFVMLTGYGAETIPSELAGVTHLVKPIDLEDLFIVLRSFECEQRPRS